MINPDENWIWKGGHYPDRRPDGEYLLASVFFQAGEESMSVIITTAEESVSHGYMKTFSIGHLDSSAQAQFFMGILESEIRDGQFRRNSDWSWFPNTPLLRR